MRVGIVIGLVALAAFASLSACGDDLPSPAEARLVGDSPWRKATWLFCFVIVEALRPVRIKKVAVVDAWSLTNLAAMLVVAAAVARFAGWESLGYLLLSTVFGVGLQRVVVLRVAVPALELRGGIGIDVDLAQRGHGHRVRLNGIPRQPRGNQRDIVFFCHHRSGNHAGSGLQY